MVTDTVLNELILQEVTQAEYKQLVKDNLLDENRVYLTPDNSLKGSLLDFKWADHLLNDISWLRADTFSWQSGDVYVAAYNHLAADFEGTTAETETIGNIEITFYRAEDKHKICLPDQEDKLLELYNKTGVAWYYILDTENKQFKLPRSKHNKYADTVAVVGNGKSIGLTDGTNLYSVTNADTNRLAFNTGVYGQTIPNTTSGSWVNGGFSTGVSADPEKSGLIAQQEQDTDQYKYLYFYVGNFERDAVEQTAGIVAEMFNGKADKSDVAHVVIEFQEPTSDNGYTWYRKYADGWVEQGGFAESSSGDCDVVLPIEMSDTMYCITAMNSIQSGKDAFGWIFNINKTATGFTLGARHSGGANNYLYANWQVSGMAA